MHLPSPVFHTLFKVEFSCVFQVLYLFRSRVPTKQFVSEGEPGELLDDDVLMSRILAHFVEMEAA